MTETKVHELKILPHFFWPVWRGSKTFEIRKDDRDYMPGDLLDLKEWTEEEGYTGRHVRMKVSYKLSSEQSMGMLEDGCAILALSPLVFSRVCPYCGFPVLSRRVTGAMARYSCGHCGNEWEDLVQ